MVSNTLYISNEISLSRLGEVGADPTFHNIKCLILREKGRGLGGGGGGQTKLCELFN